MNIYKAPNFIISSKRKVYGRCVCVWGGESAMNPFHHHHQSLNREGRWGTIDDFAASFLHFSLFSIALRDLPNSRPVHSLMLSSHLFLCPPCLLSPFTVPCKMVLARPDEQETWPYHCSSRLFTMVRRFSCGPIACWILARTYRGLQTNDGLLLLCQFCVRSSKEAECNPYKTKISLLNTYFAKFSLKTFLQIFTSVTFGLQNS